MTASLVVGAAVVWAVGYMHGYSRAAARMPGRATEAYERLPLPEGLVKRRTEAGTYEIVDGDGNVWFYGGSEDQADELLARRYVAILGVTES